ncbi:MAG: DUF4157 domain-containing protein [Spirulina sp. SIO3F2]|nr:DUF4157 domain-containing protein [Spirulina sp. SIO3F2]
MAQKATTPLTQRSTSTHKQRDRRRQPNPALPAHPVSNPPVGAIMDNVTAGPESSATVQAKLTIGEPGDQYEREADAMAAQVVGQINQPGGLAVVAPPTKEPEPGGQTVQRLVTADGDGPVNPEFESTLQSTLGKGHSLDDTLKTKLGTAMNADFSGLTIHTDQTADVMCKSIGARAFTTGSDVYFGKGEYQPSTPKGQFLITHEATHSMQQGAADVQRKSLPNSGAMVIQRDIITSKGAPVYEKDAMLFLKKKGIAPDIAERVVKSCLKSGQHTLGNLLAYARVASRPVPQPIQQPIQQPQQPIQQPVAPPQLLSVQQGLQDVVGLNNVPEDEDQSLSPELGQNLNLPNMEEIGQNSFFNPNESAVEYDFGVNYVDEENESAPRLYGPQEQSQDEPYDQKVKGALDYEPGPEQPNVPYDKLPTGTIQDIQKYLNEAEKAKDMGAVQLGYTPEVVKFIDMDKLTLLTAESDEIPILYRGFRYMPEAAKKTVLEGETISGKARNDGEMDLASAQEDFKQMYLSDENDLMQDKEEKFTKLRNAVGSHKGSGHNESNFVGTSADPDYVLGWLSPSPSKEFESYSIAVAIVPKKTDLLFRSVDLVLKAGCGITTENGIWRDTEDEYLFPGGYSSDQVVGYVTLKYQKQKSAPEADVFDNDESLQEFYKFKAKQAELNNKNPQGDKQGDEDDQYQYALYHLSRKRELEIQRDQQQKIVKNGNPMMQVFAKKKVQELNNQIQEIQSTHLQDIPPDLDNHVNDLAVLRETEVKLAKKVAKGVGPMATIGLKAEINQLKDRLGLPKEFTTISESEKAALANKKEPKVDKSRYKSRQDEIYIKKKVLVGGIHETLLMEHETSKDLVVWKPEERSSMRASEQGGSGLAFEILGDNLSPKAISMELYHPGLQAWQAGTIQPFQESDSEATKKLQNRNIDLELNPDQVGQMLAHLIADWTIGNYDNHPDQFLVGKDGSIIGLDKGQALKYTYEGTEGSLQDRINNLALEKLDESAFVKNVPFPNVETTPINEDYYAITRKLIAQIKNGSLEVNWNEPHLLNALDFATQLNANKVQEHFEGLANEKFDGHQDQLYDAIAKRANQIKAQLKQTLGSDKVPVSFDN